MKKRFLLLLLLPLLITGCNSQSAPTPVVVDETISHPRLTGEIGSFNLLTPENGFSTGEGFTFSWEAASNSDYYQLELASTSTFVTDDEDEVYVRESNIATTSFDFTYSLPTKDILYYWRVTAINKDHKKVCNSIGNFFYESQEIDYIPIEIEDEQDWVLHKQGSLADIKIDRSNFFGNNKNSLAIIFDKENTLNGTSVPNSKGWIVVTKTEDRELYGTDSFYFKFYYTGHDATILVRVLDYDGEYWHCPVQIANNAKQTILVKYEDFELRTAGTNVFNRKFDWYHIRYFEIVFERTFGDGVCLFSDIKAVKFDDYKDMFVEKMDFNMTDPNTWTYENFSFDKTISEDGSEITLGYNIKNPDTNPDGFYGYGFQNIHVYKYFVTGDAVRMKVKYTGTSNSAMFYFRILEEDGDRWQFKVPFTYFVRDEYKELIVPLKAFQRMDYMSGDGAKQFYFIQKLNFGLADNYASGTISIKDFEVIKLSSIIESNKRVVGEDGKIEDFNDYEIYTEMYYYWEQSSVNKDEAMKLDKTHKSGGSKNAYCAEFDYKADMEMATYQLYLDSKNAGEKNAFSIWLKDATPKPDDARFAYLDQKDIAAEMTIQLTMDSGEWYRYVIDKVAKEWSVYTISFDDFVCVNAESLYDDPNPLASDHIIHIAFGFKYLFYDAQGVHRPTYAIANPVYLDEIYFVNATETSIEEMSDNIHEDEDNPNRITVETMEEYENDEDIFDYWSYGSDKDYNSMTLSDDVSSQGGSKSMKMHYKSYDSVSYGRITQFATTITAKGICIDVKGDGKATLYVNLNWRVGTSLLKMRYTITSIPKTWAHYELGFELFKDIGGTTKTIGSSTAKDIESISFGIVNNDYTASDIYIDNIRLLKNISTTTNTVTIIDE